MADANGPERLPTLALERMTPRQREVADAISGGPRGGLRGPFQAWLRSPELARKAGLPPAIAEAIARGDRPAEMDADQRIVYEFSSELHRERSVSDATY